MPRSRTAPLAPVILSCSRRNRREPWLISTTAGVSVTPPAVSRKRHFVSIPRLLVGTEGIPRTETWSAAYRKLSISTRVNTYTRVLGTAGNA